MAKKHKRLGASIQEEVSPNLIPMIDIMFLLLLFFMLSADMGQRELEDVVLPKAMNVKDDKETKGGGDRLTINVFHKPQIRCKLFNEGNVCRDESHWLVGIKGRDYPDPEKLGNFLKKEADAFRTDKAHPEISERKVMIRADQSAPYGLAQRAMNVCAKAGIYKIEVGAARPVVEKKRAL